MRTQCLKKGFTLAETAIAMLVVSVGILSMFAMFPLGLENTRNVALDVDSALFAEKVFDAYRAKLGSAPWPSARVDFDVSENPYVTSDAFIVGGTAIPTPSDAQAFRITDKESDVEQVVWYTLQIKQHPRDMQGALELTLTVWPQKIKPAAGAKDGRVFYTEILRQVPL